jgi:hypothetical protein
MALVLADRVRDTTTTTSTGTITLSGTAPTGFQNFSVIGNGNTTYYTIAGQGTSEWEVGIGTYASSGTTLARTTVLSSSNSGSLVNFSAGTKDVFVTYPSERSVNLSSAALTSGRVTYATTDGLLVDSANLTFNGTTLTANTIGAFTLSGTVAGGGNQINNVSIGTSTPLAGAFTTLSASGAATLSSTLAYGGVTLTNAVTGTGKMVLDTSPTINNQTVTNYVESVVTIGTVTSSNTLSLTNGTVQTATLTASTACTFTMPTATAGKSFMLFLKQAASTGNGSATFTSVKWGTAGAPTITATAGKMDILTFAADGTNWYGSIAQGYTP